MNEPSKPLGSTQSQQPSQAAATYVAPQSVSYHGRFDPIPACRLSTKCCCANSASANLGRRDEPSYGNGSPLNTRWHISDTGRDSVPAIEVPAKISLTCNATQSFTFSMSLLVSWLSRTLPDYLTDVLGILPRNCPKLSLFYPQWGIVIAGVFDYSVHQKAEMSRFFDEATGLSDWNTGRCVGLGS